MKNNKRMLSLLTALTMTASAFSGLCISANAAETVETLNPVGATYINSTNADTNYADTGEIYANYCAPGAPGWAAKGGDGMDVALAKFDASSYVGKIIGATITLTSTCTTAGKNSEVNVASTDTDWDAATVTWTTAQTQTPSKIAAMGYAGDTATALTADVSDYVMADEDGILAFGFYTSTGRQQKIENIQLNLTVTDSVKTTYNIEYLDTDGNVIKDTVTKDGFAEVEYTAESADTANFYVGDDYYVYQPELSTTTVVASADGTAGMTLVYKKLVGAILVEDFGSISDTWGFTTTTGVSLASDGSLTLCSTNNSAKTDTKDFDESVSSLAALKLSFKWKTTVDLGNASGGRQSSFQLKDKDGNIILTLSGATNRGGTPTQVRYQIGDVVTTASTWITSNNDWYSVDLSLDFLNKTMSGTITNGGAVVVDIPATQINASNLAQFAAQNHSSLAPMAIDDVIITKGEVTPVTFVVTSSEDKAPIEGAIIEIGSLSAVTDAEGKAVMEMTAGTFDVTVKAALHRTYTGTVTVDEGTTDAPIEMEYVGVTEATKIVIAGGDEAGIYKPAAGENKTVNPYTATVYDAIDQVMSDETVTWSIVGEPVGVTIDETGIVTVTDAIQFADINGIDLTIRATSVSKPSVYADVTLHVYDTAAVSTFDVVGAYVVKDGTTVTYGVANVKDQYGVEMATYGEPTLAVSNDNIAVEGMTITPATGVANEVPAVVTVTLDGATATKDIIVYGYDFYEPGTPVASIGEPRMEEIAGMKMIVWPASSSSATATYSMAFPQAVALEKGTSKMLTFNTYYYDKSGNNKDVTVQERRMNIKNSAGATLVTFGFANGSIYLNPSYNGSSGISGQDAVWTFNSPATANYETIVFSTDMNGLTKATVQVNNGDTYTFEVGTDVADIAQIELFEGKGAPSDRMQALVNVKVTNSDIVPVEINGSDYITKIAGGVATKQYEASIFAMDEGETFTWSVTPISLEGMSLSEVKYGATLTPTKTGDAVVVVATYDNGRLVSMKSEAKAVTEGEAITVEAEEGAKVMLWNSLAGQEPMAAAATSALISGGEPTDPPIDSTPTPPPSDDLVYITQDGVLHVVDGTKAIAAEVKYASDTDASKVATKLVEIRDYANVSSFEINGPAAISAGESGTYSVANIVDQYGDVVEMTPSFSIQAGSDIASIDAVTGEMTTTGAGTVVVAVTVGNPGKELTLTKEVVVANFYYINNAVTESSVTVDVAALANYSADTEYYVTTAANGKVVSQNVVKATDGKVTVDTTGATALEVSPVYSYANVGDISVNALVIPLPDGFYDFTFKKSEGTRGDIFVNGAMVGNNVDQYGNDRSPSGSVYEATDVKVSGGSAEVIMKWNAVLMDTVSAKKAPSIVDRKQHLYILGDSLEATYYGTFTDKDGNGIPDAGYAQTGWGQVIDKFIVDDVNVTNLAESGNYTQGLYGDPFHGVLANAQPGDVLLIKSGYNDRNYPKELGSDAARYDNMKNYMELMYNEATAIGVEVIFVTPNASVHGTGWKPGVQGAGHVIEKAAELGATCIDLAATSFAYYSTTKATEEESKAYVGANFIVAGDTLHSSYMGAMKCAEIVASAMLSIDTTAHMVDTTASYDLVDTEGNMIVMQAKAAE